MVQQPDRQLCLLSGAKGECRQRGELDAARQLVGNGAYVLKDRVVNEKLVVVPNTHYWDNAKTVIQQVTFVPINQSPPPPSAILQGISISPSLSRKICTRNC